MFEKIIEIVGKEPGPTSIILAGVHGDEKCGIEAFDKILPNLKIEKGRVFFGYGNPRAIVVGQRSVRFNLNRMFRDDQFLSQAEKQSYEYKRARFLKKYLDQAGALLDLHASSTPKSQSFAICEKNADGISEYLPISLLVSGFDSVEPGGTDYYMNKRGKIGICLECGYLADPRSVVLAERGVLAFLAVRGHIRKKISVRRQSHLRVYRKYFSKTNAFFLARPFADFEIVRKGQIIGIDGKEKIKAKKRSVILFAHNCKKVGSEAFLLGE